MTQITIESIARDAASRSLKVTIPVERVRDAEGKALQRYASQARLPGFRPGKAPAAVVRKKFGDAIRQTALEQLLQESWQQAREEHGLKPIADPSVRNVKFEEGAPVEFDLHVEVKPELALATTGGFALVRTRKTVGDAEVQEQLERIREQKASWAPVTGEKPREGEQVQVSVQAFEQDAWLEPAPYTLVIGQNRAIPDLEEKILGLLPGETTEGEVKFPEDHPDEKRRGQSRRVRVTLHEVKRQELPPLDDAFAGELGDFASLDALKAAILADLQAEATRESEAGVREQLLAKLVEANAIPAPHALVHRLMHAYAEMYKVPKAQFAAFEAQFEPVAAAQVQRDLVLETVIEQQGLRATEAEVDAKVAEMAAERKVSVGQLYSSLQKAGRLTELERAIAEEKAFAFLLGQSTVTEA